MRQPDIEIYLKDTDQAAVSQWLSQKLGPLSAWRGQGAVHKSQAAGIPITWINKAVGSWHCLLLESSQTPWADDLACAQEAFAALKVEVRCAPGSWTESDGEEDADRWVKINTQGVTEFIWRT